MFPGSRNLKANPRGLYADLPLMVSPINQNPNLMFTATPTPAPQCDASIEDDIYSTDEFRMYLYKIKRCPRTRSHDWTECPFAHRGEKATRRDPRRVSYLPIACPGFKNGKCQNGDACEFAHGIFEYWLHPSRYRTRACNSGRFCQRKVCFFAHTRGELRSEKKYLCPLLYRGRMEIPDDDDDDAILGLGWGGDEGSTSAGLFGSPVRVDGGSYFQGVSEFLDSFRRLRIREEGHGGGGDNIEIVNNVEGEIRSTTNVGVVRVLGDSDLPPIDWILDLVN